MKKIIYILTLVLIAPVVFGQEDYYGNTLNSNMYTASQIIGNPTIQPPDVAAFQKVNFVPVSNYTGRVNISIPIYEITAGSMNVPISLSYNSSGVKVSDMASNVGLNWSLNAGGVISRMVKGMYDFFIPGQVNENSDILSPSGWLGFSHSNFDTGIGRPNLYNDAEPDLMVVNAPGLSTKYIHNRSYSTDFNIYENVEVYGRTPSAIELERQGNIIEETFGSIPRFYGGRTHTNHGFTNIEITSTKGVVYNFGSQDISEYYGNGNATWSDFIPLSKQESYRLDTMFNPNTNQTISFEYEEYSNSFHDEIPSGINSYNGGSNLQIDENKGVYTIYPVTQRLRKIYFDKGMVEFIYGLDRLDNTGEKALTEIKVKDNYGIIIKHVKLEYSYFQSSINTSTPQSKRLRLDRVYEVDTNSNELPGHAFTYNTSFQMPPRDSYAHDFLGYNNGSYNAAISDPIPRYYYKYHYIDPFTQSYSLSPFYDATAIELIGNFSLEANENYAQTYTLNKITFPTGGFNEYEYKLNEFNYLGIKKGGGLRIKSQKLVDNEGNEQILDYEYSDGSIAKMPIYAIFSNSEEINTSPTLLSEIGGVDTFLTPHSQVEFTKGAFVGYSDVTVKNRADNGYTNYSYKAPYPYKNTPSTKTFDSSNGYSRYWYVFGSPALSLDRDFLRGKIISEIVYNKNGDKKLEKTYSYTTKEFSTISLSFLNKSSSNILDLCYYESGTYKLNVAYTKCGGYVEELTIPIARNLLTTITTRDYQDGNETTPYTFKTIQRYSYDLQYPLLIEESKEVTVCEETVQGGQECVSIYQDYDYRVSKKITYPLKGVSNGQEISNLPFADQLVAKNKISTPLRIEFKSKDSQIIAQEDHIYKDFGNNVLALEKINFISRDGSAVPSETITKRDLKGRIVEYQKKNGIYVTKLYGYDDNYLVADIENSREAVVLATLPTLSTPYNQGTMANSVSIRALMDELRFFLPETRITSYTYDALIGITSITDPSGYISHYVYDDFNRLQYIKNKDGNVLKSYKYHYQGQYDPDVIPTYTVTKVIDGGLGSVSFNPSVVESGSYTDVTATPSSGYEIDYIKVGTTSYPFTNNTARINNITSDTEVHVKFKTLASPLSVNPTSLFFNLIDANKTVTVTASGSWTVSKSASWITISTTTGSGNGTFTVGALKNLGDQRFGTVTVNDGSTTKVIWIEQFGSGGMF